MDKIKFLPPLDYLIDGTEAFLYGDDCFYTIVNGICYKIGSLCVNDDYDLLCVVRYPTTSKNGHHGFLKVTTKKQIKFAENVYDVTGIKRLPGNVTAYQIEDEPGHFDLLTNVEFV